MKLCTVGMCNAILGNDLRGCHVSKHLVNEVCVHSIQMYRCTSNIYEVYCPNLKYIITQASVGKHESKNASHSLSSSSYLVAKWGVMGPAVPSIVRGNWEWECDSSLYMRMLWFAKKVWERLEEDVDCFWNGLAHKLYCLTACRISKVHARSHEITKELFTSSSYENTDKTHDDAETKKLAGMLKNQRIVISRIWKMRQTSCNWINRILNEAT